MLIWRQSSLFLMKITIMHTVTSLQGSGREFIQVSEVHCLINKIDDILDKTVLKPVGNTADILVVALQFHFHHTIKETFPSSEDVLIVN